MGDIIKKENINKMDYLESFVFLIIFLIGSIKKFGWNIPFTVLEVIVLFPLIFLTYGIVFKKLIRNKKANGIFVLKIVFLYLAMNIVVNILSYIWLGIINIKIKFTDLIFIHSLDVDFLNEVSDITGNMLNGILIGLLKIRMLLIPLCVVVIVFGLYKTIKRYINKSK